MAVGPSGGKESGMKTHIFDRVEVERGQSRFWRYEQTYVVAKCGVRVSIGEDYAFLRPPQDPRIVTCLRCRRFL